MKRSMKLNVAQAIAERAAELVIEGHTSAEVAAGLASALVEGMIAAMGRAGAAESLHLMAEAVERGSFLKLPRPPAC